MNMELRKRLTIENPRSKPGKKTYRAPMFDINSQIVERNCFFGELVNRLGRYEVIGTIEELEKLKKENV